MTAPISHSRSAHGWVAISGQVGQVDRVVVPGGIEAETTQALHNLAAELSRHGLTLADVVKATVFLTSMDDYDAMNAVWANHFAEPRPARSAVQVVALPLGAHVEVEAWATKLSDQATVTS